MYRGILIDPADKTIREVEIGANYREIQKAIGGHPFTIVTVGRSEEQDEVLFLDDEGLFRDDQRFFMWAGYEQPLGGKTVVLGCDRMGETVSTRMRIADVVLRVSWMDDIRYTGADVTAGETDHPALGKMTSITSRAKFDTGRGYRMTPATQEDVVS